ncbi:hypothetical protein I317_03683 [Kwoniella heveanensis CBS 569]|uniref:Uncharacterized protein n=1 Tax=Kwoniella heveanensis BCC8398 TaxID=1296120 RepID=A0A1B9GQ73_9TREE|nr:hypothetical protein I316_04995 [Kwoniella heveanensis BCC8398]OCF42438.1 hypothetical protein I317_03683 [Kwoniella heveanensis CBS 569]
MAKGSSGGGGGSRSGGSSGGGNSKTGGGGGMGASKGGAKATGGGGVGYGVSKGYSSGSGATSKASTSGGDSGAHYARQAWTQAKFDHASSTIQKDGYKNANFFQISKDTGISMSQIRHDLSPIYKGK